MEDNLYILPCLQERRQNPINLSNLTVIEKEQECSIINSNGEITPLSNPSSELFNDVWLNKKTIDSVLKDKGDNRVGLIAPSLPQFKTECKNLESDKKWEMFGNFAKNKLPNGGTLMLITHHNRMRGLYDFKTNIFKKDDPQALFPLNPSNETNKGNKCNSYANNICFRVEIVNNNVSITIPFAGFPDKGVFDGKCNENGSFLCDENGCNIKGGGDEKYCCDSNVENINLSSITYGLKSCNIVNKTVIYVIRHGNSLHNKPLNIKDGSQLDSSLTYLGMYQSKILGNYLKNSEYKNDFNAKLILGTSFLSRTQLTGLCILKNILGSLPPNMEFNYDLLMKMAVNRLSNFTFEDFFKDGRDFSPLNNSKKEDFKNFINILTEKTIRPIESLRNVETTREKIFKSKGGKTKRKNKCKSKKRSKCKSKKRNKSKTN